MAYVQFWKLPAAQYNPSTHGEGIFQCSDTGDTYKDNDFRVVPVYTIE